jgi:hypothetical protein
MKYTITLKRVEQKGLISFLAPDGAGEQESLRKVLRACKEKHNDYVKITVENPYKPRSTGKGSQNSHAWGHCQQIANELGCELHDVEYIAKVRAIKRGYPISTTLGMQLPKSQKDINTQECGYLIEEYHQIAAENGIFLKEEN